MHSLVLQEANLLEKSCLNYHPEDVPLHSLLHANLQLALQAAASPFHFLGLLAAMAVLNLHNLITHIEQSCSHSHLSGSALAAVAASYQLPLEPITEVGKEPVPGTAECEVATGSRPRSGRAAIIYAESLRTALSIPGSAS